MSGAVPPISPATGGAIYEATAKAEKAYADAELPADVEYTELQKMTSKENQAELTKGATAQTGTRVRISCRWRLRRRRRREIKRIGLFKQRFFERLRVREVRQVSSSAKLCGRGSASREMTKGGFATPPSLI